MPLSEEFRDFVDAWLNKADEYDIHGTPSIRTCFDKFFTLYVVFNRIYAEVAFTLARKGEWNPHNKTSFPDTQAATGLFLSFIGAHEFLNAIVMDNTVNDAFNKLTDLIRDKRFNIILNMVTGEPQPEKDNKLLKDLDSSNYATKATAILKMIYCIRCNMFHGHKGFHQVQTELLVPVTIMLQKLIKIGMINLEQANN